MSIFDLWLVDLFPVSDAFKESWKLWGSIFLFFQMSMLWWRNNSFSFQARCAEEVIKNIEDEI